jgi:hypothetical protein
VGPGIGLVGYGKCCRAPGSVPGPSSPYQVAISGNKKMYLKGCVQIRLGLYLIAFRTPFGVGGRHIGQFEVLGIVVSTFRQTRG